MRVPSAGLASPAKSWSTPAMIRRSVDLPAPFAPRTPILAPGRNDSQIPRRISRCGGTTFRRLTIVKMYWCAMKSFLLRDRTSFAHVQPHRPEQPVLVPRFPEARFAHHLLDASLRGIALERRGNVEVGLRVAVKDPADSGHHRFQIREVERARDGV